MGRRPALLLLTMVAFGVGCAVRAPTAPSPARPSDAAVRLARALPRGAERCAVSRPEGVPRGRRELLRGLSRAGALAWLPELEVVAQAWAERRDRAGRRAAVGLVRLVEPVDRARADLERVVPYRLLWPGERCDEAPCHALRARAVDPHTLRLEIGRWGAAGEPGVEARCLRMARARPAALEVSSLRGRVIVQALAHLVPRWVDTVVEPVTGGVRVVQRRHMRDAAAAIRARKQERADGDAFADMLATRASVERRGAVLISRKEFRYEDLALAAEDVRRIEAARERSEPRLLPRARIALHDRKAVTEQVRLRQERLAAASPAMRPELADDLHRLLVDAVRIHPEHHPFARALFELLVGPMGRLAEARALAERMLEMGTGAPEAWKRARRRTRALEAPEALARALVRDRVMSRAQARRAAPDLVEAAERGDYELAELAYRIVFRMDRGVRLRPAPDVTVPGEAIEEAARVLARLASEERVFIYFLLRGDALRRDADPEVCLPVHDAAGRRGCFGAFQGSDLPLPELVRSGPFDLTVALAAASGDGPTAAMRWRGEVGPEGGWRIARASGKVSAQGWEAMRRLVMEPLGVFRPRLFPPPELVFRLDDEEQARRLVARARPDDLVGCTVHRGPEVRCHLEQGSEEAPVEVLTDLVEPWAGPPARSLFVPLPAP